MSAPVFPYKAVGAARPTGQKFVLDRWPQTDEELFWWVRATWGVIIPRHAVCPGHVAPFKAFADAFFARYPVCIWKASRGFGGKTQLLSILGMSELVALGAFVTILGGSGAQSLRVHETMTEAWYHPGAPKMMLAKEPTKFDTLLTNGGKARTLMASTASVRGPHPQRMRLDEIDEMDMNVLESAQGQPMRKKNQDGIRLETNTVMSSTHQYPDGTMTAILKRAQEEGWPVYEWCVVGGTMVTTTHGDVPITEVRAGDTVLTREGWRRVQHQTYNGEREVVTVELSDGRSITCTPDHKIATPEGWVEAGQLTAGSTVYAVQALQGAIEEHPLDMLPVVLAEHRTSGTECAEQGCHGACSGECSSDEGERLETGNSSSRTLVGAWVRVSAASSNRDVRRGLPHRGGLGSRGVRVEPREVEQGARRGSRGMVARAGVSGDGPLVDFTTSVVAGVHPAGVEPVYDIGVEGCHEFVGNGIVVHNCYKESANPIDGWLDEEEIDRKRSEINAAMWSAEYDLQEPSFTGRAIEESAVERMFNPEFGVVSGDEGRYIQIEAPRDDRDYVTGVDWAKARDFTVIWTWDATEEPWRTVAFERINRRPWPVMVERLNERLRRYGGKVAHDATGIGSVVDDYIEIPRDVRPRDIHAVTMAGRSRSDMITNYVSAIEKGLLIAPRIIYAYDEHRFATPDDLYNGTSSSHLPDSISAGALAWSLRNTWKRASAPVMLDMKRDVSPWLIGGTA